MKISRRKLAVTVVELLKTTTDRQTVITSLAAYLLERNMTHQAELLLQDIATLLSEKDGQLLAEVTTATALDDAARARVATFLTAQTGAKKIQLQETVNPTLLGGIKISVPGREYDASVRTKLKQLQA